MNVIRTLVSSAICFAAVTCDVNAESVVLFDVKEQCRAIETTQGIRYLAPCTLPDKEFTFRVSAPSSANNFNNKNLIVDFQCESLRPLTMSYEISHRDQITHNASMAPAPNNEDALTTFSLDESDDEYTFKLVDMTPNSGFQAIKPGCKVEVSTSATVVPDELPIGLATKIAVAKWHANQRIIEKRYSTLFKERLTSAKYRLESMDSVLQETLTDTTTGLPDVIKNLDSLLASCGSNYCPTTVLDEIKQSQIENEQALLKLKQQLEDLIDEVEDQESNDNDDYIAWTTLQTLIIETLQIEDD